MAPKEIHWTVCSNHHRKSKKCQHSTQFKKWYTKYIQVLNTTKAGCKDISGALHVVYMYHCKDIVIVFPLGQFRPTNKWTDSWRKECINKSVFLFSAKTSEVSTSCRPVGVGINASEKNQVILQPSPTLFKGSTQFQGGTRNHSTPRLQLPSLQFSSCTPCNAQFLRYEEFYQAAVDLCLDVPHLRPLSCPIRNRFTQPMLIIPPATQAVHAWLLRAFPVWRRHGVNVSWKQQDAQDHLPGQGLPFLLLCRSKGWTMLHQKS